MYVHARKNSSRTVNRLTQHSAMHANKHYCRKEDFLNAQIALVTLFHVDKLLSHAVAAARILTRVPVSKSPRPRKNNVNQLVAVGHRSFSTGRNTFVALQLTRRPCPSRRKDFARRQIYQFQESATVSARAEIQTCEPFHSVGSAEAAHLSGRKA